MSELTPNRILDRTGHMPAKGILTAKGHGGKDYRTVNLLAAEMERKVKQQQSEVEKTIYMCIDQRWDYYKKASDLADHIKYTVNEIHGPNWHCIIGKDFGYSISHEERLYFSELINGHQVTVFKSG